MSKSKRHACDSHLTARGNRPPYLGTVCACPVALSPCTHAVLPAGHRANTPGRPSLIPWAVNGQVGLYDYGLLCYDSLSLSTRKGTTHEAGH